MLDARTMACFRCFFCKITWPTPSSPPTLCSCSTTSLATCRSTPLASLAAAVGRPCANDSHRGSPGTSSVARPSSATPTAPTISRRASDRAHSPQFPAPLTLAMHSSHDRSPTGIPLPQQALVTPALRMGPGVNVRHLHKLGRTDFPGNLSTRNQIEVPKMCAPVSSCRASSLPICSY